MWTLSCRYKEAAMKDVIDAAKKARADATPQYVCGFCNRGFTWEKSLIKHSCAQFRRSAQEHEPGVQKGFETWLLYLKIKQGSKKVWTYEDFCKFQFYESFVKFGRHIIDISAFNPSAFMAYVIVNSLKLDEWCHVAVYQDYIKDRYDRESSEAAMIRSIETMMEWANQNKDSFENCFRNGNGNVLAHWVSVGKLSPWVLYNCESGLAYLGSMNPDQLNMVIDFISPEYWQRRFELCEPETVRVKELLKEYGL